MQYGPKILSDGLVLCLDAADRNSYTGSGATWMDLSNNNNTGTLTNGPTFSSANGGSVIFDGINDYVDCGNGNSINFGTGDFTVEVWARRDTNATINLRLLSKGADSDLAATAGFCFFGSDTLLSFAVNPNAARTIINAATYSVGEWFQVIGLIQRGVSMRTYKNAILVSSTTAPSGSVSNASLNLNIGRNVFGANLYWPGNVAIVRIYNKALSANEVLQNFNATRNRFGI